MVFIHSYVLAHYVGDWTGERYSIVHFTLQVVHHWYLQETGLDVYPFETMSKWYQKTHAAVRKKVRGEARARKGAHAPPLTKLGSSPIPTQ